MINLIITILILQADFSTQFNELIDGEKISKEFASNYLKADEQFYGQYFEYTTFMKPKYGQQFLTLVYKEFTGSCNDQHIATFSTKGELISQLQIKSQCDQDMAVATDKSWSYQLNINEGIIYLYTLTETVTDKSLIGSDGYLIGGNSFDELETETLDQIETYLVSTDGTITKMEE